MVARGIGASGIDDRVHLEAMSLAPQLQLSSLSFETFSADQERWRSLTITRLFAYTAPPPLELRIS